MCQDRQSGLSCCCWSLRRDDTVCLQLRQLWTLQFPGQKKDSKDHNPLITACILEMFKSLQPFCSIQCVLTKNCSRVQAITVGKIISLSSCGENKNKENTGCIQYNKCLRKSSLSWYFGSTNYIHRRQIILAYRDNKLCQLKLMLYHNYQKMLFWPLKKIQYFQNFTHS